MSEPLFRTEVLQARRRRWLGEVVLDQPPSLRVLSGLALAAAVGIGVLLCLGEYTRRTRVTGQLVPTQGLSTVTAPVAGILDEVPVQEGQRVLGGDTLALVSVPRSTRAAGDTLGSVERSMEQRRLGLAAGYASQRRRLQAQAAGLAEQQALARVELDQLQAEAATRRRQQALAEQSLARHRVLRAQQYITELQLQQQETQALELLAAVQSLERQQQAARRQLAELAQAGAEVPEQLAQFDAAEARELASLSQERIEVRARAESVVQAPLAGSVGALFVHAGQPVQAGQALMALLPASGKLEAHLLVPSAAVGFIAPGDTVLLRYPAFPYQKFGHQRGRVLRVSRNALAATEPAVPSEPVYRVVVALERQSVRAYGRDEPLRPGLALEADILGERRRLWEWVLEPLYTLGGRATAASRTEAR